MALDLYASGNEKLKNAAESWADSRGLRIEYKISSTIKIGGSSSTVPVKISGAKPAVGQGLPVGWGELRSLASAESARRDDKSND